MGACVCFLSKIKTIFRNTRSHAQMWQQLCKRCGAKQKDGFDVQAKPACQKGLNMSLYSQGFGQATSGLTPRPWFWAQDRVVDFLQPLLAGRKAYDVAFKPDWCERRTGLLKNQNWKHISDTLKVVRRTWKGKGVH